MINVIEKLKIKTDWVEQINQINAIYNFIIGGRNGRKSTKIQDKILNDYFKDGKLFLLLRRKTDEIVSEAWFTPYIIEQLETKHKKKIAFKKTIKKGERYTGYFFLTDLDGSKPELIGKVMYLSMEQKYKSNEDEYYNKLYNVVYEEFIANTNDSYLSNEVQKLVNIISTVFRSRPCNIFLIGNTLEGQENNPYFRFFEIDELELKVNDLLICENEYKVKIAIFYIANQLNNNIPEYQKIKNNLVGTTGEWQEDKNFLEQDINKLDGDINFLNFCLIYRNIKYYLYEILEKGFKYPYVYITSQIQNTDYITNFEDFKQTLPEQHQNYNTKLLHFLYPSYFEYNAKLHTFEFKHINSKIKYKTLNLDDLNAFFKDNSKNDNIKNFELLQQLVYNKQIFCNNKSLLFWLKNERKDYIKKLIW